MSGFSLGMMQNLLNANTAMTSAQANTNAISRMEDRKNTLEAEIKSGNGDVEGKEKELEQIAERRAKAEEMQQAALNQANSSIGQATEPEEKKTDEDKTTAGASDEAKQEAKDLENKVENADVAAVDYQEGMHISSEGNTGVAISPEFLETMAQQPDTKATYQAHVQTMQEMTEDEPELSSQTWSVNRSGVIDRHAVARQDVSAEQMEALQDRFAREGREAFGESFGTCSIVREQAAQLHAVAPGMLVDANV